MVERLALTVLSLTALVLMVSSSARAEDPLPLPPAPSIQTIGFMDADPSSNCSADDAMSGRCVERVWLYMPSDDLRYYDISRCPKGDPACPEAGRKWARDPETREAASENISASYAQLWDVLARRWSRDGDVPQATLIAQGYTALPLAADQWEMEQQAKRKRVSVPEMEAWYQPDLFAIPDPDEQRIPSGGIFAPVSYRLPDLTDPGKTRIGPYMVLMEGRFALRMGYEGRRYDYNVMDADPGYSGPFFEQFFPFNAAKESERPLHSFNRSVQSDPLYRAPTLPEADATYGGVRDLAINLFDEFVLQTGTAIARFAMREYTLNQLRSLAAVTLMRNARFGADLGGSRDLVAAARSQTDAEDAIAERLSRSDMLLSRNFSINPARLPDDVIVASIRRWVWRYRESAQAGDSFYESWREKASEEITDLKKSSPKEFADALKQEVLEPSSGALRAWLRVNLSTDGVVPTDIVSLIWRIGLIETLERSPQRHQEETRLLLDHVQYSVLRTIDTSGKRSTPNEVAKMAGDQWQNVLSAHGESTRLIEQGLGAVDPNAICTLQDGRAALDEGSIGLIDVDLLVEGRDTGEKEPVSAEELLWENRERLPFIVLDDPNYTRPEIMRVVGLPEGRAIWRVRWRVWSGWHLLWSLEPVAEGYVRMTARTTTFCENMVLAEPRLVPTLVRASLLSGTFKGTDARLRSDGPLPKKEKEAPSGDTDAAIEGVTGTAEATKGKTEAAKGQVTAIQEGGVSTDTVGGLASSIKGGDGGEAAAILEEEVSPEVRYLRDIVHAPLWRSAVAQQGMLLFVFDHSPDTERPHDARPRTPYLRVEQRAPALGEADRLRTSAWAWFWTPEQAQDPLLVAPAWRPVHGEEGITLKPGWRQVDTADPHLVMGALAFPWRQIEWTCDTEPTDYDVVSNCAEPGTVASSGMGINLLGGMTWWIADRPQIAIDSDLEAHLEMLPPGLGLYDETNTTYYAWMFAPQFGLSVGFRWAPLPAGLSTNIGWPWGADQRDGNSRLVRGSMGVRSGILAGSGFNGLETTLYGEAWGGFSVRSSRNKFATLTPYHPRMWISPFVRYSYSFLPIPPTDIYHLLLESRTSVAVGLRWEMLLTAPPKLPEGG